MTLELSLYDVKTMFAPDTRAILQAAVDLVNSASDPDTLVDSADLRVWARTHAYLPRCTGTAEELRAMRGLRSTLRDLLSATRDDAAGLVNGVLRDLDVHPQLVRHDAEDWHVHLVGADAPLAQWVLGDTAWAMIDLIREDELSRIAVCADATCDGLVLDLSRNRSRKFCSTRCANRNATAAFRSRQRASASRG
jgi:predicted RNA-binding Zn ribbon-like protein